MVIWTILLAILAGMLYRLGGWKKGNTKIRDFGVPFIATIWLMLFTKWHIWPLVIHFGLLFGALTTYEYFLPDNPKKGPLNWILHGIFCGLAAIPLIWCGVAWWWIIARAFVLAITMTALTLISPWVWIDEWGRGALIMLALIICK